MFTRLLAILLVFAAWGCSAAQENVPEDVVASGLVVDADGQPAAGVEIARLWSGEQEGMQAMSDGGKTEADGRFRLTIPAWMTEAAILALDAERSTAGVVTIKPKESNQVPTIKLTPAVKVFGSFESKELGRPLTWTNVYINTTQPARLIQSMSETAKFGFVLPPGKYQFHGYGRDVEGTRPQIEVPAGVKELDLGAIDLAATQIAKHVGKAPPRWFVKEARGLKQNVTIADLKGKWVLVDFWGHWCGPCVQQLSEMIDFYESHAEHRDQFEIIAFHDSSVPTLQRMDQALVNTKRTLWDGRDLPFPILLDADRQTQKVYGIQSWPTTVLIDPEGKLVGEVGHAELEKHLPKLPDAVLVARALNKKLAFGVDEMSLSDVAETFGKYCHIAIRLDEAALASQQIDVKRDIPLTLSGALSLRSWLNLFLAPDNLTYRPEGDGLLITAGARNEDAPSQQDCAARLRKLLDQPLDFDFQDKSLSQVMQYLENKTRETFILDPAARRSGAIDINAKVTGTAKSKPLGESLQRLFEPLKLVAVVRDEAIVIESR